MAATFGRHASGATVAIGPELSEYDDEVLLSGSDNPDVVVRTTRAKLRAFLGGAKEGEFDDLA
ncbi:DUF397 domain-containing protein [Streptomyces sp. NPDC048590]|uniref:DUF397 domain-containing protein n=1 Tax=Streptomyces sp. NPDC048590 TaxID=3365574 RepID=UPI003718A35B